jgi:phage tail sheath protein FI
MGFLVSPGVEVKEIDLTNVIPALSTSIGGFAGQFKWGSVGELTTVSSENDLAEIFGKPDDSTAKEFLQAAGFLKYGNTLKISRAIAAITAGNGINSNDTITATAGTGSALSTTGADPEAEEQILNLTDFYAKQSSISTKVSVLARCPGAYGNSLKVIIGRTPASYTAGTASTEAEAAKTLMRANFDVAPNRANVTTGSAGFAGAESSSDTNGDEIHVLVIDEDGKLTGTVNNVIEKYQGLSLASDAKNSDGSSNYYYDVINNQSQYIFINKLGDATNGLYPNADSTLDALNADTVDIATATTDDTIADGLIADGLYVDSLTNGQDGTLVAGDYQTAIDLFEDADTVDVNLLIAGAGILGDSDQITVDNDLISCASTRKDCVAFVSAPIDGTNGVHLQTSESNKETKVTSRRNSLTNLNSYSFMDSSPLYVYNKYADNFTFIAASGHMAGLCAQTDGTNDPWFSPAGYNRGNLKGVTKLAFNPTQSRRDTLYKAQINPIVSFPGQGILLFGDKTGQVKASAFDRINVRRLFIVLEKAISTASKFSLFELNDEFTRAQFRNLVEPFLRDVKGRRGITDFLVVCDETNNTGQVIDTNRFVADIYIKPARSINFITLNFVATRTGVEFSEVVGG